MIYENEYAKAKLFLERKTIVHLSKLDGMFYNGLLVEVGNTFVIIDDREDGHKLVLFSELKKSIDEFMEEEK